MLKTMAYFLCTMISLFSLTAFANEEAAQENAILTCRDCNILACDDQTPPSEPKGPTKW